MFFTANIRIIYKYDFKYKNIHINRPITEVERKYFCNVIEYKNGKLRSVCMEAN